jgi:hypothetical protein
MIHAVKSYLDESQASKDGSPVCEVAPGPPLSHNRRSAPATGIEFARPVCVFEEPRR